MTSQNIMVVIPPEMSDHDERYSEIVEYAAACTGFSCVRDDLLYGRDSMLCSAYFEDDRGNIWRGQLHNPPYPDGSQKYVINLEKKAGEK